MADEKPPVDLDKRVLRYNQRQELQREIDTLTVTDRSEDAARQFRTGTATYDRRTGRRSLRKAEKMLEEQGPQHLTPAQREWVKKEKDKLEEKIKAGMPTKQEMRTNPPGTVARHMKWERFNKQNIKRWQNAKVLLEPDSDDPELTTTETLRPEGVRWIATDKYRENYEEVFGDKQ